MKQLIRSTILRSAVAAIVVGSACGPAEEPEETDTTETTGNETETAETEVAEVDSIGIRPRSEDEIPRPPKPWAEMTPEEKGQYMGAEVLPYFRTLFREYDPEEFATVNCATCHGADMNERGFEMPNPDILALHPSGTPEQQAMVEAHPRMVRFMFRHVVPAMRQMLDQPEFDEETGEGFSCYFCHPHAEGEQVAPAKP